MIQMIAKKDFRYDGAHLKAGQRFKASDRASRIFRATGRADDAPARKSLKNENPNGLFEPEKTGEYARRDMRPQD